ncbi:trypsin-1 [Drosophila simulans]|uniref:trypsin n=1 Tax=Drosophila simulans TaxID=7240 RepID=A0A0J9QZW1_DROSI|nr:trypsin-1 [Drosophila simulans]KMY89204.1 uncharacterized protein Dsimw501_GD29052 [Drosophila simulans]
MRSSIGLTGMAKTILQLFLCGILLVNVSLGATVRRPRLDGRIVGGQVASIKDIPYQVSLQRSYHFCGGSLIAQGWVLTAAHCTEGSAILLSKVRIGSSRTSVGGQLVGIKRVHRHPKFDAYTIDFDFSLLELEEYSAKNVTQAFVGLPEQDADIADGTPVLVSGWGNTQSAQETSAVLRSVTVPKVSQTQCTEAYGNFGSITDRMLCAGLPEGGKDACQGDSGGPLAADGVLWGVVSWGYGCARPNYPGVYSRVSAVRDWIGSVSGI